MEWSFKKERIRHSSSAVDCFTQNTLKKKLSAGSVQIWSIAVGSLWRCCHAKMVFFGVNRRCMKKGSKEMGGEFWSRRRGRTTSSRWEDRCDINVHFWFFANVFPCTSFYILVERENQNSGGVMTEEAGVRIWGTARVHAWHSRQHSPWSYLSVLFWFFNLIFSSLSLLHSPPSLPFVCLLSCFSSVPHSSFSFSHPSPLSFCLHAGLRSLQSCSFSPSHLLSSNYQSKTFQSTVIPILESLGCLLQRGEPPYCCFQNRLQFTFTLSLSCFKCWFLFFFFKFHEASIVNMLMLNRMTMHSLPRPRSTDAMKPRWKATRQILN